MYIVIYFQAMEIIKDGLCDTWVTPAHKLALSQRAIRISQSPKSRHKFESVLNELTLLTPSEPRSVTITGRSLPRFVEIKENSDDPHI